MTFDTIVQKHGDLVREQSYNVAKETMGHGAHGYGVLMVTGDDIEQAVWQKLLESDPAVVEELFAREHEHLAKSIYLYARHRAKDAVRQVRAHDKVRVRFDDRSNVYMPRVSTAGGLNVEGSLNRATVKAIAEQSTDTAAAIVDTADREQFLADLTAFARGLFEGVVEADTGYALQAFYIDGQAIKDIHQEMGWSRGFLDVRLQRTREALGPDTVASLGAVRKTLHPDLRTQKMAEGRPTALQEWYERRSR